MTIGEVSEITGVSVDKLRYYERIGLIPKIHRNSAGIRDYDSTVLGVINLIIHLKNSGMKLESIRKYIILAMQDQDTGNERQALLAEAKERLEEQLVKIKNSLDVVNYKIDHYKEKCGLVTDEIIKEWKAKNSEI